MEAAGARRGVGTEARSRKGVVSIPLPFHRELRKTWAEVRADKDNDDGTTAAPHSLLSPPELPPFGRAAKKQPSNKNGSPIKDGTTASSSKPELSDEEKEARRIAREQRAKLAADKRAADEHNADGEWSRVIPGDPPPPKPKPPPPPPKKEAPSYVARGRDAVKFETIKDKKIKHDRAGVAAPVGEQAYTPGPGSYDGATSNPRAAKSHGTTVNLHKQTGRDTALLSRIPTYRGGTVYIAPTAAIAVGAHNHTTVPGSVTKLARDKGGRLSRVITEGIRALISIVARLEDIRIAGQLTRHAIDKVEHELFDARQRFKTLSPWLPIPPPVPIVAKKVDVPVVAVASPSKKPKKVTNDDAMDDSDNHDSDMDMDMYDDDYDTAQSKRAIAEAERQARERADAEAAARKAEDDDMAIYDDPKPRVTSMQPSPLEPIDEVALLEEELQHLASHDVQQHKPASSYRMKLAGKFHRLRRRIERLAGDILYQVKTHFEQVALHPAVAKGESQQAVVVAAVAVTDPLLRLEANVGALQKMVQHATHVGCTPNSIAPINALVAAMQQRLTALHVWQQKQLATIDSTTITMTNNDAPPNSNDRAAVERAMTQLERVVRDAMSTLSDLIRETEIFAARAEEINSAFKAAPRGYSFAGKAYEPPAANTPAYIPPAKETSSFQLFTELARGQDNISNAHRALADTPSIHGGSFSGAPRNPADSAANRRQVASPLKERFPFLRTPREQRAIDRAADAAVADIPFDIIKPRLAVANIGVAKDDNDLAAQRAQEQQQERMRETRRQLRARIRGRLNDPAKIGPGAYDPGYVLDKHIGAPSIGQPPTDDEQMAEPPRDRLPGYGVSTTGGMGPGHHLVNDPRSIPGFKIVNPDANAGEESPQARNRRYRERIREILAPRRDDEEDPAHPRDAVRAHVPSAMLDGVAEYQPTDQQRLAEWRRTHQWKALVTSVAADDDRRTLRGEARAQELADRQLAIQRREPTRARSLSPLHKLLWRLRHPSPDRADPNYDLNRPFDRKPVFQYHLPTDDVGKESGVTARRKIWHMERRARNAKLAAKLAAAAERHNQEQQAKVEARPEPFDIAGDRPIDLPGSDEPEGKDRGLLDADRWRNYRRDTTTDFGKAKARVEPRSSLLDQLEPRDGDELVLDTQRGHRYMNGTKPGVAWSMQQGRPELTLSDTEIDYNRNGRDMPIVDVRKSNKAAGHKFDHDLGRPSVVQEDDRELYLSPRYTAIEPAVHTINFGARTSSQRPPPWNPASRDLGGFTAIDDDILHKRTRQTDFTRVTGRYDQDTPRTGLLAQVPHDGDVLALSPRTPRAHQPGVDMTRTVGRDNETKSPRSDPSRFLHLVSPKRSTHGADFTKAANRFEVPLPLAESHDGDELLLDPKPIGDDTRIRGHVSMASRMGRNESTRRSKDEQRQVLSPQRADSKSMVSGPSFAQQIGRPTPYTIDGHADEGDHLALDPSRTDHVPGFVFGTSERFPDIPTDWIGRPSLLDIKDVDQLAAERRARETKSPKENNHDILTRVHTTDYHRFPLDPTKADGITMMRTPVGSSFAPPVHNKSPRNDVPPRYGGLPHAEPASNPLRGASMKGPTRFKSNGDAANDEDDEHSNSNDGILDRDQVPSQFHHISGARWEPEHKRVIRPGRDLPDDTRLEDNQPLSATFADPPPPSAAFARVIKPHVAVVDDRFALSPRYTAIEDRAPVAHINSNSQRFKQSRHDYDDTYLYPNDDYTRRDARSANFAMSFTNHDTPIVPPVAWHRAAHPLPPLLQPPSHHIGMIVDRYYTQPLGANAGGRVNGTSTMPQFGSTYEPSDAVSSSLLSSHLGASAVVRPVVASSSSASPSTRYQPLPISASSRPPLDSSAAVSSSSPRTGVVTAAATMVRPSENVALSSSSPRTAVSDDPSPRMVAHVTSLLKAKMRRQRATTSVVSGSNKVASSSITPSNK